MYASTIPFQAFTSRALAGDQLLAICDSSARWAAIKLQGCPFLSVNGSVLVVEIASKVGLNFHFGTIPLPGEPSAIFEDSQPVILVVAANLLW